MPAPCPPQTRLVPNSDTLVLSWHRDPITMPDGPVRGAAGAIRPGFKAILRNLSTGRRSEFQTRRGVIYVLESVLCDAVHDAI